MDKDSKETLAQVEKVLKGAEGFVFVGLINDGSVEGGLVGNKTSMHFISKTLAKAFGMTETQLGVYLMKSGLGLAEDECDHEDEKPAKKKVAKKAVKKVTKKVAKK